MKDLIDRKELLKIVEEDFSDDCGQWYIEQIEEAPRVEAEPIRYGHWEPYDKPLTVDRPNGPVVENHTYYRCSLCKKGCYHRYSGTTYCPECGAKMRKEDE